MDLATKITIEFPGNPLKNVKQFEKYTLDEINDIKNTVLMSMRNPKVIQHDSEVLNLKDEVVGKSWSLHMYLGEVRAYIDENMLQFVDIGQSVPPYLIECHRIFDNLEVQYHALLHWFRQISFKYFGLSMRQPEYISETKIKFIERNDRKQLKYITRLNIIRQR